MNRIPILGEDIPIIDTSPPSPINDPFGVMKDLSGPHYHGSRPKYPGEEGTGRVTVWLADLEKAQTWLLVWQTRAIVAFYTNGRGPGRVCLLDRNTDEPRATVDGREARVSACTKEHCTRGIGAEL